MGAGLFWLNDPQWACPLARLSVRLNRWSKRGRWGQSSAPGKHNVTLSIDSTSIEAHRSAGGGKKGARKDDRSVARRTHHEIHALLMDFARLAIDSLAF
jgi:hypothetical protein